MFYASAFWLLSISLFLASISLITLINDSSIFLEWGVHNINSSFIAITVILDWNSCFFTATVSIISMFIIIYSVYYIEGDKNATRFSFILISFVISMLLLIISPNLISLILGWDGLGLTSYALVIYYNNEYSANSGMITILSNRVGDATLLLGIGWMLYLGSYNFALITNIDGVVVLLIIISSFTNSAQIPFSAWLPAAMAAPTPVSALVHSSTLVTAGVFLIIRFAPLINNNHITQVALIIGTITILMAGWSANFETDFNNVIALSTLSQLGLIFIILGLNQENLAFFHLIIHALFKSALFMCAGFIIHNISSSQDGRFAGSFAVNSPTLGLVFGATNLSLCGFPFMTGFFSNDMIIESSFSLFSNNFIFAIVVLATGLTLSYSMRSIFMTASTKSNTSAVSSSSDLPRPVIASTLFLFVMSTLGGYLLSWLIVSNGCILTIAGPENFSILIIMVTILIIILSTINNHLTIFKNQNQIFSTILYLPNLTNTIGPNISFVLALQSNKSLDKGWLELAGPQTTANILSNASLNINNSNTLNITTQFILAALVFLLILIVS